VKGIQKCTEAMPNCNNQNDCCIGNYQQFLDALSPHKSYEDSMKDIFDILDAFFMVSSKKMRGHIPPDIMGPRGAIHVNHLQVPCGAFFRWDLSWGEHVNVTYSYLDSTRF
jgi:hypothetical protein